MNHGKFASIFVPCVMFLALGIAASLYNAISPSTTDLIKFVLVVLLSIPSARIALIIGSVVAGSKRNSLPLQRNEDVSKSISVYPSLIVMPVIVNDVTDVEASLDSARLNFMAGIPSGVKVMLLVDFRDFGSPVHPHDAILADALSAGVEKLNRLITGDGRSFELLIRRRAFNAAANTWMGWERKRGKIVDFLSSVETGDWSKFHEHNINGLENIRLVITLDRDTLLMPGAARDLINISAHPENRPFIVENNLVSGYTMVVPRIFGRRPSRFGWFFGLNEYGAPRDPRPGVQPDYLQDCIGESIFQGKGLIDVRSFNLLISPYIKENSVLSHDHLEGMLGRVALASDVVVTEDNPVTWEQWSRRQCRWIRGDFLLLPWIIKGQDFPPGKERAGLAPLSRWLLLENLVRHLSIVCGVCTSLLLSFIEVRGPMQAALVTLTVLSPQVPGLPLVRWAVRGFDIKQLKISLGEARASLRMWLVALFMSTAFAMVNALGTIWAIILATKGIMGFRKDVLDWNPSSVLTHEGSYLRGVLSIGVVGLALVISFCTHKLPLALFAAIWVVAPISFIASDRAIDENILNLMGRFD